MPRQVRIEYEGAIYHVMARGNRRGKIVLDDEDRQRFEQALQEVVHQTGWFLYAYALMDNHYHLVFQTPEANLVRGMTWFQSTLTKRFNARHRLRGHLFSGRYKAIIVEENDYLSTLIHYVHLNPVRAGKIQIQDGLDRMRWTSFQDYLCSPRKRRDWVAAKRGLEHLGYEDCAKDRRRFLSRVEGLVDSSRPRRSGLAEIEGAGLNATLRRGWYFGGAAFKEKMEALLEEKVTSKEGGYLSENGYQTSQLQAHNEAGARNLINESLKQLQLKRSDLPDLKKMDVRKAMIARLIRRHTRVKLTWIAEELCMGVRSSVTRADQLLAERLKQDRDTRKLWRMLEMQQISS